MINRKKIQKKSYIMLAEEMLRNGKFKQAMDICKKQKIDPIAHINSECFIDCGLKCEKNKDFDDAFEAYKIASKSHPSTTDIVELLLNLGQSVAKDTKADLEDLAIKIFSEANYIVIEENDFKV